MKAADVKIGAVYAARVSGKIQHVKIVRESVHERGYGTRTFHTRAWVATNIATGREVFVKSAQRLRYEITAESNKAP